MKTKTLTLIRLLSLGISTGCEKRSNYKVQDKLGFTYSVFTLDGCEYIQFDRSATHKGNCTNIIHGR